MPGWEIADPLRTDKSRGFRGSPKVFPVAFSNSGYILHDLIPEIFRGRRIAVDNFPAAKDFSGNDKPGRYRKSEVFQLEPY